MSGSEEQLYITSTQIRDYLFCPNILYNKYVMNIKEPVTMMMINGKERFEEFRRKGRRRLTLLGERRIKPDKILYAEEVYSRELDVYGVIDIIYWIGKKAYIVEIKDSDLNKAPPDHLYQAVAYALMAEETFNTLVFGVKIYYSISGRWVEKRITREMRRYTKEIIREIKRIFRGEYIPEPRLIGKCRSCWYRNICFPGRYGVKQREEKGRHKVLKKT
jgi:CRISPR-associated exonuclease Cas4